jgi:omega-amidase
MTELRVTFVQFNPFWENATGNRAELEERLVGLEKQTDVVVLPEMFTTGFSMAPQKWSETMDGPTHRWMKVLANRLGAAMVGSWMVRQDGTYYNRLFWVEPGGLTYTYDKIHLFSPSGEDAVYSAGKHRLIVSFRGWRICPLICYDLRFGYLSQQSPSELIDAYLYVASWPAARTAAWQALLKARAIENQAYVVGVNRIGEDAAGHLHDGYSGVYDFQGTSLHQAESEDIVSTVSLDLQAMQRFRDRWPFWKDQKLNKNFS